MADFILGLLPFIGMVLSVGCVLYLVYRILRCLTSESEPVTRLDESGDPVLLPVEGDKKLYLFLVGATFAVYAFLASAAWSSWDVMLLSLGSLNFNLGLAFGLPILVHAIIYLRNVPEDKTGGIYFYGHALKNADPGLHFVPFMRIETGPKDIQKIWAPGKRDQIFWGDEKDDLPPGMVRPIFMNTREATAEEQAAAAAQMTIGLGYALFWRISDFLTFNAHTRSEKEADDQIRSISEGVLGEDIATRTVNGAITGQREINQKLDNEIRRRTQGWGVEVMRANLTIINVSHELAKVMRDRTAAKFKAETRVIDAQAEAREIELKGEADGKAEAARAFGPLEGRAHGLKLIKEKIGSKDGDKVHERETLRDALAGGKATFVGGRAGLADLAGMFDFVGKSPESKGTS